MSRSETGKEVEVRWGAGRNSPRESKQLVRRLRVKKLKRGSVA